MYNERKNFFTSYIFYFSCRIYTNITFYRKYLREQFYLNQISYYFTQKYRTLHRKLKIKKKYLKDLSFFGTRRWSHSQIKMEHFWYINLRYFRFLLASPDWENTKIYIFKKDFSLVFKPYIRKSELDAALNDCLTTGEELFLIFNLSGWTEWTERVVMPEIVKMDRKNDVVL